MNRKLISVSILLVALLLGLLSACTQSKPENSEVNPSATELKTDQPGSPSTAPNGTSSETAKEDNKAEFPNLVQGDAPNQLNSAERKAGYAAFYPLGVKFRLVPDFEDQQVKRRHLGFEQKGDQDPLYFSRSYYFRPEAGLKAYEAIKNIEDEKVYQERLNKEVKPLDRPLFGFFVFREDYLKDPVKDVVAALDQTDRWEEFEEIRKGDGYVTYFARGREDASDLEQKEAEKYTKLMNLIPEIKASVSTFKPEKPEESFKGLDLTALKADTLTGKTVSGEVFKESPLTILMYWVSWCPDCLQQMKNFQSFRDLAESKGVHFLSLCSDAWVDDIKPEVQEAIDAKMKESGWTPETFTVLKNSEELENAFFIRAMNYPTLLYVDQKGKILKATTDYITKEVFLKDLETFTQEGLIQLESPSAKATTAPAMTEPAPQPAQPAQPAPAVDQDDQTPVATDEPYETLENGMRVSHDEIPIWEQDSEPYPTKNRDCGCGG